MVGGVQETVIKSAPTSVATSWGGLGRPCTSCPFHADLRKTRNIRWFWTNYAFINRLLIHTNIKVRKYLLMFAVITDVGRLVP